MATIDVLLRNIRAVKPREIVEDSLENTKQALIRLQRLQMLTGYKSDGKRIGKYKNKDYAVRKAVQNPLAGYGNVDLRVEGYFQADIFVEIRNPEVIFDSANDKTQGLVDKYGPEIFGLNKANIKEYTENYLKPEATKLFKEQILK